jgi:hypothetical protein
VRHCYGLGVIVAKKVNAEVRFGSAAIAALILL